MKYTANFGVISILTYTSNSNLILYSTVSNTFAYYAFNQSLTLTNIHAFNNQFAFKIGGYK